MENSVKPSSKATLASSRPMARNLRGVGDLAEDLSRINDAEVKIKINSRYLISLIVTFSQPFFKQGV